MPGLLRVALYVLMLMLMVMLTQALAFSWRGPLSSPHQPQALSRSGSLFLSSRHPRAFWWRSRRRSLLSSSGLPLGPEGRRGAPTPEMPPLELDNSIATMGQPALNVPSWGWGFAHSLRPGPPPPSSSVGNFPSRLLSSELGVPPMDRRDRQLALALDKEVMKNVIRQVLGSDMRHRQDTRPSEKSPKSSATGHTAAPASFATTHQAPSVSAGSLPRQAARSSTSRAFSYSIPSPGNVQAFSYSVPSSSFASRFGDSSFQPAGQNSPNGGFSSVGFGSFAEPAAADFGVSGGFGPPVPVQSHSQKNAGAGAGEAHDHSQLGFGGFGQMDTAVGHFGWLDPQGGPGDEKADIKPIPTAVPSAGMGSFSQEDKDCDSILTKSCQDDSECQCYGFYFCNSSDRCEDLTSAASPDSSAAMTFGEKWHDGPAEKLGLTGRRRR